MKRYGFGRFAIPGRVMSPRVTLPAVVALALAAALAGIFTAQAQNDGPTVAGVKIISSPASGTSYGVGEEILVKVTFNQTILLDFADDSQAPQLKLDIGGIHNRTALYMEHGPEYGGDDVLIFRYVVTANDHENYGISISYRPSRNGRVNPLILPSGGRAYGAGGRGDANLQLSEHVITLARGHRVNAATPEPPTNVSAVQDGPSISIVWEQPGSILPDYYIVERRYQGNPPAGDGARPVLQRTNGYRIPFSSAYRFSFNDENDLYNGAAYEYRVRGYQNNHHYSRISETATVTFRWAEVCDPDNPRPRVRNGCLPTPTPAPTATPTPTPAPDAAPQVTETTDNSVTIDWSRMIGDGGTFSVSPTANGFHLSRRASTDVEFTNVAELSLSDTHYQDTGLTPGTTYTWRLYEDHPQHRYNLMGEVTHTTLQ